MGATVSISSVELPVVVVGFFLRIHCTTCARIKLELARASDLHLALGSTSAA